MYRAFQRKLSVLLVCILGLGLIALVIFSTALLGVVGTAAGVGGFVNASHVRLQAGAIAREQIEELLTAPYDSLKTGTVTREGVRITWTVQENDRAKEMLVVYRYNVPSEVREDTLTAALIKPW